ncbi:hypothetical protein OG897_40750 [Streptomyces sp. NBC_00237]|uniref:hypothetical protein n=1 Tax=Streptomyces sp. NBC_00237 TaxID=2975687 RepID=UPI0022559E9D|nr:hypothetical protein [Streptomyces sp. NBC_00237]MCX5207715.1 hypothetical protein [Streptomyces sp. NBC_00237]
MNTNTTTVTPDPETDAYEREEAAAADVFRIKATRAHGRIEKGLKAVREAAECAAAALARAEAARWSADEAAERERERAYVRVAEADALMWSHAPGTDAYRAAFSEFLTARFDAESMPAAMAAEELAEHEARAEGACGAEWSDVEERTHTGAGAALEAAEHAYAETKIEFSVFEQTAPAGRYSAESACDLICLHSRDMAAAVRHAKAAAQAAETAATEAEAWADVAEEADTLVTEEVSLLFSLGADTRQVAAARAYWGVSDAAADAVVEVAETVTEAAERRARVADAEANTEEQRAAARPAERAAIQRAAECAEAAAEAEQHAGRASEAYAIARDLMRYTRSAWAARPVDLLPEAEAAEAWATLRLLDRRSAVAYDLELSSHRDPFDGAPVTDPQRARDCASRARMLADGCEADARRVAELFAWEEHARWTRADIERAEWEAVRQDEMRAQPRGLDASTLEAGGVAVVVSDPEAVDTWEGEGGFVPGVETPSTEECWLPADDESGAPAQWSWDRTRHYVQWYRAQDYVPALGWATAHVRVLEAAESGRLRMLGPRQFVALTGAGGARPVKADRVRALYAGGFLVRGKVRGTGDGRWAVLMPSHAGREALALCLMLPTAVHASERDAYAARLASVAGRSWMGSDERKEWASEVRVPYGMMSAPGTTAPGPEDPSPVPPPGYAAPEEGAPSPVPDPCAHVTGVGNSVPEPSDVEELPIAPQTEAAEEASHQAEPAVPPMRRGGLQRPARQSVRRGAVRWRWWQRLAAQGRGRGPPPRPTPSPGAQPLKVPENQDLTGSRHFGWLGVAAGLSCT